MKHSAQRSGHLLPSRLPRRSNNTGPLQAPLSGTTPLLSGLVLAGAASAQNSASATDGLRFEEAQKLDEVAPVFGTLLEHDPQGLAARERLTTAQAGGTGYAEVISHRRQVLALDANRKGAPKGLVRFTDRRLDFDGAPDPGFHDQGTGLGAGHRF